MSGKPVRTIEKMNTVHHRNALVVFGVIVVAHWAEHISQAVQIYVLGWPVAEARGVLGIPFPWLIESEWLHYGYALIMLVGFALLLPGFREISRPWWHLALWLQVWHHLEHFLLLLQALSGVNLAGAEAPTSLVQLLIPRVELHLLYNTIVTVPMVVAIWLHRASPSRGAGCTCAVRDEQDLVTTDPR
ncbi:hypothetical protein [Thermobifida cellulosilytica]|uniref:Uncharacterized protein n=1 Tax=Thermobifida cellulosilytica TB100 TaxID=665004 RepID=A0A147KKC3_THECS|nr:hypothetical protein [Thermobifida cellulosilytica]KUP97752.1 hypothetical protein AC529_04630 [Thermobifida cellulosilytica TB100]